MIFAVSLIICILFYALFKKVTFPAFKPQPEKETLSIEPTEANIAALRDLWAASERKPFDLSRFGIDFETLKQLHADGYVKRVKNGLVLTAKGHVDASILMRNQWVAP